MSWCAMMGLVVATTAQAKDPKVFVNGERADGLRDVVLEEVSIRFDERGHMWITAPQYIVGGADGASAHEPAATGQWWLAVTDNQSANLAITVAINGRVATTVRSGQGGGTLDVGPWLHRGANQVVLSAAAGEVTAGGPLIVEIGEGAAAKIETVNIRLARDPAAATEPLERTFVLRVP